jgi:hypothetical protein
MSSIAELNRARHTTPSDHYVHPHSVSQSALLNFSFFYLACVKTRREPRDRTDSIDMSDVIDLPLGHCHLLRFLHPSESPQVCFDSQTFLSSSLLMPKAQQLSGVAPPSALSSSSPLHQRFVMPDSAAEVSPLLTPLFPDSSSITRYLCQESRVTFLSSQLYGRLSLSRHRLSTSPAYKREWIKSLTAALEAMAIPNSRHRLIISDVLSGISHVGDDTHSDARVLVRMSTITERGDDDDELRVQLALSSVVVRYSMLGYVMGVEAKRMAKMAADCVCQRLLSEGIHALLATDVPLIHSADQLPVTKRVWPEPSARMPARGAFAARMLCCCCILFLGVGGWIGKAVYRFWQNRYGAGM